jgi:pSer/pThr/pTyr-binding forkhead associated (FHA) protein
VTQKLVLYFLGQGDGATRVLDAEHQPTYTDTDGTAKQGWTIGRLIVSAIVFKNPSVSKHHAAVSARVDKGATVLNGEVEWIWELTDHLSTNGTFLEAQSKNPYRLLPGVPYQITEGSVAQFGAHTTRIKFSFDNDDTLSSKEGDTDPQTEMGQAVADRSPQKSHEIGHTLADVVVVILTGPEGIDSRLWWVLCGSGALLALWIHKQ